ncbi:MAG: cobyric acid synthase [Pseudomonadota bacterium]
MLQGTGSDVGKSTLVAALARIARRRGLTVAPFKPQNMSNNAAACETGGEIGRAQALQAMAAGLRPEVDFNPVLLKPQTDRTSQVVVHGHPVSTREAAAYMRERGALLRPVMESFQRLIAKYELVIVEGAGSPAEINLREGDIANMGFARHAQVPVCIVADIERGGVIASLVGTKAVLEPDDAALIKGFIVNKFRGDPTLFDSGIEAIERRTGWRSYGVVPWLPATARLPAEDAVSLIPTAEDTRPQLTIVAPMLSRMANFDDADPLSQQEGVQFDWVKPGQPIPRSADVVILFGTKSTLGDLKFLREQGWDHDILAHAHRGGRVLGICGGFQMLGHEIHDPDGVDGPAGRVDGLGLLDVATTMRRQKTVQPVNGRDVTSDTPVTGYEIHAGETVGPDCRRAMFVLHARPDGARSLDGRVSGTYVHGMFASDVFRERWLVEAGARRLTSFNYRANVESALNNVADHVERVLDVETLFSEAATPSTKAFEA